MTIYDMFLRMDAHRMVPARVPARRGRRANWWTASGPADLRVLLFFAVTWLFLSAFAGNSTFLMAAATGLTICANLVYVARSCQLAGWTRYMAWVMRAGAAISAWWLFVTTPSDAGPYIAVVLYAAIYFVCERTVWRRARLIRRPAA